MDTNHSMRSEPEQCPNCGNTVSGWLKGNCPVCLMQLGAQAAEGPGRDKKAQTRKGKSAPRRGASNTPRRARRWRVAPNE